jgi:hypothetical protein
LYTGTSSGRYWKAGNRHVGLSINEASPLLLVREKGAFYQWATSCRLVDVIEGARSGGIALEDNAEADMEEVITLQDYLSGFGVRSVVLIVWTSLVGVGALILPVRCLQPWPPPEGLCHRTRVMMNF